MQDKKHRLVLDVEQWTGSEWGKLTSVQCTSHEMPDWMNHKVESELPGEIPATSDTQMIPL